MENSNLHLSFEFSPAKTAQAQVALFNAVQGLAAFSPDLITVTSGAGGSNRDKTLETLLEIRKLTSSQTGAHLACIGSSTQQITALLDTYRQCQVKNLLALRGDIPTNLPNSGDFKHAIDLVKLIRAHSEAYFQLIVAAYPEYHPEATSPEQDFQHFHAKVLAGANLAFTQYFYNPDAYFHFIDQCEAAGINIPIIPGIMPILNYKQLAKFSDSCGAEIPRWIRQKLAHYDARDDKASMAAFGIDVVSLLAETLLENGAPGLHIYTMNCAEPTATILQNLGF